MGTIRKMRHGKAIALCILLACIFTVVFSNAAYAAAPPALVSLEVQQKFTRPASSLAGGVFRYMLAAKETTSPMPTGSTNGSYPFVISDTGSVSLGPISFSHSGQYDYEIKQVVDSPMAGYYYDPQVYTVSVYITEAFETSIIVKDSSNTKVTLIAFENRYAPLASDPAVMVDPPVKKTVSGTPACSSIFTFRLVANDKTNPMPAGSVDGIKTVTVVGSGETEFGTWSYTEAKTYYYSVYELNTGESGYFYDATVYTITDTVADVNGQLVVTRTTTNNANKQVAAFTFINQYTAPAGNGLTGPQTGGDSMTGLYRALLYGSIAVFFLCAVYLFISRTHKKNTKP